MDTRDDFVRTSLRIPKSLHDRLSEAAGRKRSINAEIISRLESTFVEVVMSDEDFEAAFSGVSPFEEAVNQRAGEVLKLAFQMAADRLEAEKVIGKDGADIVREHALKVPGIITGKLED